jgi:TPR repeat protein
MSEDELKRGAQDAVKQKNEALAVSYIKALAERGNSSAQLAMGDFYKTGHIVEVNSKQAVYWYRKAAELGNPEGNTRLALAYLFGTLDSRSTISAHLTCSIRPPPRMRITQLRASDGCMKTAKAFHSTTPRPWNGT